MSETGCLAPDSARCSADDDGVPGTCGRAWHRLTSHAMGGAIAIIAVLLIFPTLVLISGGVVAAIFGYALQRDGEIRNEGSELLSLPD